MKFNGRKVQNKSFIYQIKNKYEINKKITEALNILNKEEKKENNKELDIQSIETNVYVEATDYDYVKNTKSTYLSIYIIYSIESEKEEL